MNNGTEKTVKADIRLWLAFAAIYIIWGTTYLAIKIGIEDFPPFMMAAIRYLIAGFLLLVFSLIKKEKIFSVNALRNMVIGAFIMTFGQAIAFWSEKYISSGLTAVFGSLLPICYIITDRRNWFAYKESKLTLVSIALGIIGIIVLFINPSSASGQKETGWITIVASVVTVAACFCWAAGSLYFNYNNKRGSLYENVGWQLIGGMVCCFLISLVAGEWRNFNFSIVPLRAWMAVFYLAIAGSIVALISLYWLLARRPAALVGTYAYVNPVIAVLLGYLIAKEEISIVQIIGMCIILVAAYLANNVKFKSRAI
jgi:drug/metabolite transporter (DMT)-like permease